MSEVEFETSKPGEILISELHNRRKTFPKKETIQNLRIEELDQENNIFEDSQQEQLSQKCTKHPEEDLQFYCFNRELLLCSECLVSGKYVGFEISNLRKAVEKLRGKFNKFALEVTEKFETYNMLEQEIRCHEEEIEGAISTYEQEISKIFNYIRQKVNEKEQELLNNLQLIKQHRINECKSSAEFVQKYRQEIEVVKAAAETELKVLNELGICQYYQEKNDMMREFLNNKDLKTEAIKETIENQKLQDQMGLCKLQNDFKTIVTQLDALTGIEYTKAKQISKDTKPERRSFFFANLESDMNTLKESRDTLILRPATPSRSNIYQKPSYIPEDLARASSMQSFTTNIFEKHIAKVHEIRRQTPKQDMRSENNILSTENKKSETKSLLMLEMRRNNIDKKYAGLCLNDSSSILEAYKDNRNKNLESKTPKTFMFSSNLSPSNQTFGPDLTSPNSYKGNSFLMPATTKASDEKIGFDSSIRYIKFNRTTELKRKNSTKISSWEHESSLGIDIGKIFAKRKFQERKETPIVNDTEMKKKLNNLSSSIFK